VAVAVAVTVLFAAAALLLRLARRHEDGLRGLHDDGRRRGARHRRRHHLHFAPMTAAVAVIFGVTFAASVAVLVLDTRDDDGLRRDGRHRHELTSALAAVHDLGAGPEAELFLELPGRAAVGIRRGRGEARQL